jgi:hypothetical protein
LELTQYNKKAPFDVANHWGLPKESQFVFKFISFSYLHSKAEELCGYDCIEGNFDFSLKLINLRMFPSVLILEDGKLLDIIVIPYIKHKSISSLICLCDDYEGITNALFAYDKDKIINIKMDNEEEDYIFKKYPEFKEIYIKYNHYILDKII